MLGELPARAVFCLVPVLFFCFVPVRVCCLLSFPCLLVSCLLLVCVSFLVSVFPGYRWCLCPTCLLVSACLVCYPGVWSFVCLLVPVCGYSFLVLPVECCVWLCSCVVGYVWLCLSFCLACRSLRVCSVLVLSLVVFCACVSGLVLYPLPTVSSCSCLSGSVLVVPVSALVLVTCCSC